MNKELPILDGLVAKLQSWTQCSWHYELHANVCSVMGWIDIQFPCNGTHELRIAAYLDERFLKLENLPLPTIGQLRDIVFSELKYDASRGFEIDVVVGGDATNEEFDPGSYY